MKELAIVSISGGKDSTATALLALEALGAERCRFVFVDTGNEHELTYDYVNNYLPQVLGPITTLRADLSAWMASRREGLRARWMKKGVPEADIARAEAVMQPTGNAFLDLCIIKGRFPSRKAQFCTQHLKRIPLDAYLLDRMGEGYDCQSWRGIRRDESDTRKNAPARERVAEGFEIVHPVVDWTAQQVVDFIKSKGVMLNPLYSMGMARVGCMPCINTSKDELLQVALRFPQHIDRIRQWEALVSAAAKRGYASYFHARKLKRKARDPATGKLLRDPVTGKQVWVTIKETPAQIWQRANIDQRVAWAKTKRGGKLFDMFRMADPPKCSSQYGLCE